jgi:uncharacterized protein
MPVRNLPSKLDGFTLVQLSDIHVGRRVDDEYVLESFRKVAALKPDLVVYTGDFIDYNPEIFEQAGKVYSHAPQGRIATLGILGNHDYGPRWASLEIAKTTEQMLGRAGIRILRNETLDIEGLQIMGLDDLWAGQFNLNTAAKDLDKSRPVIALSHNPDTVDLPEWANFEGWILSGHTHGGQCKPPFLPPPLLPVKNRRYTAGEFDLGRNRQMYINRGLGHLLGVRFNVRPEITVFELSKATA